MFEVSPRFILERYPEKSLTPRKSRWEKCDAAEFGSGSDVPERRNHPYFLPWTPIRVSPIGIGRSFTSRGSAVLQSELLWIWIPAGLLIASALLWRRRSPSADD